MKKAIKTMVNGNAFKFGYLSFLGVLIALGLSSCQKENAADVNQDKIWTEYSLYYDQNNDKTYAIARFRFGNATGTLLELVDSTGSHVTFNGKAMPYSLFWSAHELEFAGNITTGTFAYTNTKGVTYTNAVPAGANAITYPAGFNTIVKSQAETFSWVGSPLAANQSVGMYIGTWAWDKDALFYTDADGASSLVLGVQAKSGLTPGQATVYMLRRIESSSINGTSKGGLIRYSYRPIDKSVVIVP